MTGGLVHDDLNACLGRLAHCFQRVELLVSSGPIGLASTATSCVGWTRGGVVIRSRGPGCLIGVLLLMAWTRMDLAPANDFTCIVDHVACGIFAGGDNVSHVGFFEQTVDVAGTLARIGHLQTNQQNTLLDVKVEACVLVGHARKGPAKSDRVHFVGPAVVVFLDPAIISSCKRNTAIAKGNHCGHASLMIQVVTEGIADFPELQIAHSRTNTPAHPRLLAAHVHLLDVGCKQVGNKGAKARTDSCSGHEPHVDLSEAYGVGDVSLGSRQEDLYQDWSRWVVRTDSRVTHHDQGILLGGIHGGLIGQQEHCGAEGYLCPS
mmetsp:Transcript_30574/g.49469  ORF Transcript_30574/g.49469 Transcript_30574/m.49469 type:complete len:320 (+) Transcript_30574:1471-2430(+)